MFVKFFLIFFLRLLMSATWEKKDDTAGSWFEDIEMEPSNIYDVAGEARVSLFTVSAVIKKKATGESSPKSCAPYTI
jgi:hypothetical protein